MFFTHFAKYPQIFYTFATNNKLPSADEQTFYPYHGADGLHSLCKGLAQCVQAICTNCAGALHKAQRPLPARRRLIVRRRSSCQPIRLQLLSGGHAASEARHFGRRPHDGAHPSGCLLG